MNWDAPSFAQALRTVAAEAEFLPSSEQFGRLERHAALLVEWNQRVNLTRIVEPGQVAYRHFGESLMLARALPGFAGTVVDVGSGGGFPGAVLAVMRPEIDFVLLEPRQKKAVFLKEALRGLPNVAVQTERIESWAGSAAALISRAVRPAEVLAAASTRGVPAWVLVGEDVARSSGLCFSSFPWDSSRGVAGTVEFGCST